jgi:type II secretory pathway pseudopilin PulG
MHEDKNGFTIVEVILLIVFIGLIGSTGWYVWQQRTGKAQSGQVPNGSQNSSANTTKTKTTDPYKDMTKYSNDKYGIRFYHPKDWSTEEVPIDNPSGATPIQFAVNIKGNTNDKYAETASLEIHTQGLQEVAKFYDGYYGQSTTAKVSKQDVSLKGKQSIHYTFTPPPGTEKTEHYLFAVGTKTYSLRSINEDLNVQRSPDYWVNFQKIYDSLQIK